MKICDRCRQHYPDDSLKFCLFDGSVLSASNDSEETILIDKKINKEIINEPQIKFSLELFRIYCLFGFETDGKTDSVLWNNPMDFHHSVNENKAEVLKTFNNWKLKKRKFTNDEILDGKWVKIGTSKHSFYLKFHDDGTFTENDIFSFDENDSWSGKWKLIDGVLRLNIEDYELDIVASIDGLHSGVEDMKGVRTAYFRVIHVK